MPIQTANQRPRWNLRDLIYGVIVPTLVAFAIVGISVMSSPAVIGIKYALLESLVIIGVPMLIGMIWNQWAGGASGFLMGSMYTLFFADQLYATQSKGDMSLLGNLVSAMLIGYVAGVLSKKTDNYGRLAISGVTAGLMGAFVVIVANNFSSILGPVTLEGSVLSFLPRILGGLIVPLVARAFLQKSEIKNTIE